MVSGIVLLVSLDSSMTSPNERKIRRLSRELNALTQVAKTLSSPFDLPELLTAIMDKIIGVLDPADVGTVMLWEQSAGLFRPAAAFGYDLDILKKMGLRAGESITGKVYDKDKVSLFRTSDEIAEAMSDMRPANRVMMTQAFGSEQLPRSIIASPISVDDTKYGVLVLENLNSPSGFNENDLPFVKTLADLIALAIERARLETKADAIREARRTERLRSEVMATLSHQLRMPLTVIRGYATALLMDEVEWSEAKHSEFLGLIEEQCQDMEMMIRDILDTSLIEVDQLTIRREPLLLQHLANDIALETQHQTELHRLVIDFPVDFPIVEADPHWIKQIFRNILDNAVKYSLDGGLIVIKGEERPSDVVISIADQGIGVSPEDLIPLFEKYFRVKSASTIHIAGTGLGLPIARAIVEAHGGRIWAESKLGEGTTLYFSLPKPDRVVE
jgi:K+-sensing histidine kinase KdpD